MFDSRPPGEPQPDVAAFEARLRGDLQGFFEPDRDIFLSRAPGRLDCLGGIIDYCGGTVCEMPLREAAVLALQKRQDRQIRLHSLGLEAEGLTPEVILSLDDFGPPDAPLDYPSVRAFFRRNPKAAWAGYVAGAFYVLQQEGAAPPFRHGANILLSSSVPLGAGVSSSAAIEVAAMVAIGAAYGLEWEGLELARLAQKVENQVVGAPCGIMDQVTAALGRENQLLLLECQPCRLLGYAALPEGVQVAALHSGVKHAVGGSKYTDTRIGAFMGHAIILAHLRALGTVAEDPFRGYVCNIPPEEYVRAYRHLVPTEMRGQAFLDRYGNTVDSVTTIDPHRIYRIRSRLEHHIYEQGRVQRFRRNLEAYGRTREKAFLEEAGRQMYGSHWSYGARCGLGAPETDLLVALAREIGPAGGVYGAKITGGGSGGTVAFLGDERLPIAIAQIAERYAEATGITPHLFRGSSPGALATGVRVRRLP